MPRRVVLRSLRAAAQQALWRRRRHMLQRMMLLSGGLRRLLQLWRAWWRWPVLPLASVNVNGAVGGDSSSFLQKKAELAQRWLGFAPMRTPAASAREGSQNGRAQARQAWFDDSGKRVRHKMTRVFALRVCWASGHMGTRFRRRGQLLAWFLLFLPYPHARRRKHGRRNVRTIWPAAGREGS